MSHDEDLTKRVREALSGVRPIEEKEMLGGLAFLVRGHMACAVVGNDLVVRMDKDDCARALERPGARPMPTANGMLLIGKAGTRARPRLQRWVWDSLAYVRTLPPPRG